MSHLVGRFEHAYRHLLLAAAVVGLALAQTDGLLVVPGAAAISGVALLLTRSPVVMVGCACALVVGCVAGETRLDAIDRSELVELSGRSVSFDVYLTARPRTQKFGRSARVEVAVGRARGEPVELRIDERVDWPQLTIGDGLRISGELAALAAKKDNGKTEVAAAFAAHLNRQGVHTILRVKTVTATGARRTGVTGFVDALRRRTERGLSAGLSGDAAALMRGMVIGGDEALTAEMQERFKASGLTHITAVSGANVLLLVILIQACLALFGAGPRLRIWLPVALIAIYVPLCGAGASVIRAGVMGIAALVAISAARPVSRAYTLMLAAAVLLIVNPRSTADIGAQLSFVAVLGLIAMARPFATRLAAAPLRMPAPLAEALGTTIAATIATAPLMALHFGRFSIVSLLANVLVAPAVGPIVWLGSLSALAAQITVWPAFLLNGIAGYALGFVLEVARMTGGMPGATVALKLSTAGLMAAYLTVGAVLLCVTNCRLRSLICRLASDLFRGGRVQGLAESPSTSQAGDAFTGDETRLGVKALLLLATLVVGFAILLARDLHLFASQVRAPPHPAIVFIDVGQGDATAVFGSAGCTALIDGGPAGDRLASKLKRLGVKKLDLLVTTHPAADHHGGLVELVESGMPVAQFFDGGGNTRDSTYLGLRAALARQGTKTTDATAGVHWRCGDLKLDVLGPQPQPRSAPPPDDANIRAVVSYVQLPQLTMLTSGDAESPQLLPLPLRHADVLKVPHHGSEDAGLARLLSRVRPELAVIPVGRGNSYGHPAASTLAALGLVPATRRTDIDGDVVVVPGGHEAFANHEKSAPGG